MVQPRDRNRPPNRVNLDRLDLLVGPNPNDGNFNIIYNTVQTNATIEFFNIKGQLLTRVIHTPTWGSDGYYVRPINLNVAAGVYFARISTYDPKNNHISSDVFKFVVVK